MHALVRPGLARPRGDEVHDPRRPEETDASVQDVSPDCFETLARRASEPDDAG